MYQGDRDLLGGGGGEDVAADLEKRQGECSGYDVSGGAADTVAEGGNGPLEWWEEIGEKRKEDAPGRDEEKLDECEGNGFREDGEN